MSDNRGPWEPPPERRRSGFPIGVVLWLALMAAVGIGIWLLADRFPGRLSSDDGQVDLVRLLSILALISSGLLFARRINFSEMARNIALWTGAAAVLVLIYTYQEELLLMAGRVQTELLPGEPVDGADGTVSLTQGRGGHFFATGKANGTSLQFMIDTGATDIVLSPADARRIGIDPASLRYTRIYQTANGTGRGAPYRLATLSIGPIQYRDVRVSINEAEMNNSLLGMSFLRRLSAFEIHGRKLILRK
ncbi:MAG: TIGR02281 family clan AA aspartic protease [Rhodospirillaceae bacterium]|jgi:aspartyl protease family protein|nr:TIGR02281 family clan AA aspartic protease [Rhodospirillaceae bacterium]MBT4490769.1 TIGR02281 family clan AA aspartic protease [Rhodospirillaceae bacterium]MBT5897291.1 TIGR02281 family clan AA aspartic protease [Rhodospirillaceae bacterium]MBT6426738.1 TIGR02281 family clan AA aspartic protease [Rhodospirillaceae bacterium]MBT7758330.1 TIGR02281 family clan AA aspartic protease [Rhodospirillaceae bacterium]